MKCPSCQHENRPSAKFCEECAAPLSRICAGCGCELRPTAKFCDECGANTTAPAARPERSPRSYTPKHLADKILQSKSALEGERKQVTVLFADVKGSMELAALLDPEQWHQILDRFFQILSAGVHRFEGTINQYTGDGIMALFGAPIAHEDHTQRACYAALHLRDRLRQYGDELRIDPGVNFSFRIGLNSGEVVVGRIGDDLRMDYTAQGHTVGLAQRMEQLAPADGIALSQHTHKPVAGFFNVRALGPLQIKGAIEPVEVFVLEGMGLHRTRLDTSRARGLSRFVGRGDETDALETALARSLEGTGRVAAVVGEPGVGKSRLCAEFIERCKAADLRVFEAHCPAHGKTIPYLPLLELLRNLFGITERDDPAEARQKIAGALALLDDGFVDDRALVLDFLGVADPKAPSLQVAPEVRQRRLFTFIRRLLQLKTEADPIVLLIDDLHWIDSGSDLFVAQIVEAVSTTRTLLLVNFRPEYAADWLRKSWVLQLPMAPLGADALTELVRDWVGSFVSVAALPALIGARCGGNPFFAEEIVLSLIETGRLVGRRGAYELTTAVDAIEVPATVQALLAARIDRLGEHEKQLLYAAAVIGKEFSRPLLESVVAIEVADVDAALSALLAAELINERLIYPVAEYSFKHPLTHEVALHTQLTTVRRVRHAAVAEGIAAAAADRLDEQAGLLAHHWTEAGEAMRAASWHVRAARWVSFTDLAASRRHWAKARQLLIALPDSSARSRLLLEVYPELMNQFDLLGAEAAESETVFHEAIDLARRSGNRRTEALMEAVYGNLKAAQNDFDSMIEHAERAVALADAEGDRPVGLFARYFLGRALVWQGRWEEGVVVYDQSAEIGGGDAAAAIEVLRYRPYVECLAIRANAFTILGRAREALEFVERFPELLRIAGVGADLSSAASDRMWPCLLWGDAPRARRCADEALQIAERYGGERGVVYALMACGSASALALKWAEGHAFLERAQQRIAATGAGAEWSPSVDAFQALCLAGMGERERSLYLVRRSSRGPATGLKGVVGFIRARALRVVSAMDELDAEIAETLAELQRVNGTGLRSLLLLERAGLARLRGDPVGLARDLNAARRLFAQMGVTGWDDYARSIET
ncbi:MAG: AAA family ATPase [Gammaproteobacteria bacterium]|nr:AAA family ATPase [Gammaproteobacteria bacterium]